MDDSKEVERGLPGMWVPFPGVTEADQWAHATAWCFAVRGTYAVFLLALALLLVPGVELWRALLVAGVSGVTTLLISAAGAPRRITQ